MLTELEALERLAGRLRARSASTPGGVSRLARETALELDEHIAAIRAELCVDEAMVAKACDAFGGLKMDARIYEERMRAALTAALNPNTGGE